MTEGIQGKKDIPTQKPHSHDGIYSNDTIAIMKKVAPNFGFTIQTLAKEGEQYSHQYNDRKTGELRTYTGKVPEGQSCIKISHQIPDLSKFFKAVEAEQKDNQSPTNSPKA